MFILIYVAVEFISKLFQITWHPRQTSCYSYTEFPVKKRARGLSLPPLSLSLPLSLIISPHPPPPPPPNTLYTSYNMSFLSFLCLLFSIVFPLFLYLSLTAPLSHFPMYLLPFFSDPSSPLFLFTPPSYSSSSYASI